MVINFAKLQATGNDFIVLDARNMNEDWTELSHDMCHRHFGIGADGLILVMPSNIADLEMRLFNSDGSEAEVTGNGLRCFAKYVIDRRIVSGPNLTVETLAGIKTIQAFLSSGKVNRAEVDMGTPRFQAEEIPVVADRREKGRGRKIDITQILDYPMTVAGEKLSLSFVSMGNPHAVSFVARTVAAFPLHVVGPKVEHHAIFPQRANFEVAKIINRVRIEARAWERGVGETLSCGSGACAIAVIAKLKGYTNDEVDIMLPGGILTVRWDGVGEVYLAGMVGEVFTGEWVK